ncbi:type II toxin-antitoxin system HicA family toxin [bacterium]|nr:type II toxin-antitoxin system HicA family toxin [FCB group bacterium]MBL7190684.1 type II toxin-antitoxin system HicA family toxin [bacterium]
MPKLPSCTPKELIKILQKNGFILLRSKGSHQMYHNPISKRQVIIPFHHADLPKGTLHSIFKKTGIKIEDI